MDKGTVVIKSFRAMDGEVYVSRDDIVLFLASYGMNILDLDGDFEHYTWPLQNAADAIGKVEPGVTIA